MNEAETRADLIDPALKAAGWGIVAGSRVRRELIAPGRLLGSGRRAAAKYADHVLEYIALVTWLEYSDTGKTLT